MIDVLSRENLKLVAVVVFCLLIGWTGPAVAHGVHAQFAHNADKVDGKHAVAAGASLAAANGKLVAHNRQGKLPAKFLTFRPVHDFRWVHSETIFGVPASGIASATATCPTGTKAIAGAFSGSLSMYAYTSSPSSGGAGWVVDARNEGPSDGYLAVHALCAKGFAGTGW